MTDFVEFDECLAEDDGLVTRLRGVGFSEPEAEWLAEFFRLLDFFNLSFPPESPESESQKEVFTEQLVSDLRVCVTNYPDNHDARMIESFQTLLGFGESFRNKVSNTTPWESEFHKICCVLRASWRTHLANLELDWSAGIRALASHNEFRHELGSVLARNLPPKRFDWTAVLDMDKLSRETVIDTPTVDHSTVTNPGYLEFWIAAFSRSGWTDGLDRLPVLLDRSKEENLLQVTNGILRASLVFRHWSHCKDDESLAWRDSLSRILVILEEKVPEALFSKDSDCRKFVWMDLRHTCNLKESDSSQENMLAAAHEALGKVRKTLRETKPEEAELAYTRIRFHVAIEIVNKLGNPWRATKSALLALRELKYPSVGADLRYWSEYGKAHPPTLWCEIPSLIADQLRFHRRTSSKDARIEEIRDKFAQFCLDRLKTTQKDKAPIEGDPMWRGAYIRALRELRSNPSGRGHHVLHWVSENDPDDSVRRAASDAYKVLRKNEGLPTRTSPLTALFAAFWWLRQAHVLSLGGSVDPAGASRTRAKEVRRTT